MKPAPSILSTYKILCKNKNGYILDQKYLTWLFLSQKFKKP